MRQEIEDAIEKAIKREKASYTLYSSMCKKAENPNTDALFRTLALQEMKHEALLKEFLKSGDMMDAKEEIETMYMDCNLKIVDNLNASSSTFGLMKGFELAIKREQNAQAYYQGMIDQVESEILKDILTELIQEEKTHERLLRKEYQKLYG